MSKPEVRAEPVDVGVDRGVVDCDVHISPTEEGLLEYMPAEWRERRDVWGNLFYHGYYTGSNIPRFHSERVDLVRKGTTVVSCDLDLVRSELLDPLGVEYAMLTPFGATELVNQELAGAICSAINDWQINEWFSAEPRVRGAIVIPYEDAELSVAEIERVAGVPGFSQVLMLARTGEPMGRRKYWPIFEAATRHGYPIGIHAFGWGGHPFAGAAYPSFYIEEHNLVPTDFQYLVTSLICEGTFDRIPKLRVALIESGFAWLAPLMYRLDRAWKMLRAETGVKRLPSEYVREHFWFTTQPIEEPATDQQFLELLEEIDMPSRMMFSSDFPHWDFDDPRTVFPSTLSPEQRLAILSENARALYGLPAHVTQLTDV